MSERNIARLIDNDCEPVSIVLTNKIDPGSKADASSSLENLENCIADIQLRMASNLKTLNDDNTNVIYMSSP